MHADTTVKMGKIVLYYTLLSPPSRAVLLTGHALGLEFDLRNINLLSGDHLSDDFKKVAFSIFQINPLSAFDFLISIHQLNPQHTIPVIIDDGVTIYDSHAICAYLVEKYAKTDALYPKDLAKRAEIDARLHFDTGFLFPRLRFLYEPILYFGSTEVPQEKVLYIEKCWPLMEAFLERGPYLCGNEVSIADFCCIATVSSFGHYGGPSEKYPKLLAWIQRMSELPDYQRLCGEGGDVLVKTVDEMLEKNRG